MMIPSEFPASFAHEIPPSIPETEAHVNEVLIAQPTGMMTSIFAPAGTILVFTKLNV